MFGMFDFLFVNRNYIIIAYVAKEKLIEAVMARFRVRNHGEIRYEF